MRVPAKWSLPKCTLGSTARLSIIMPRDTNEMIVLYTTWIMWAMTSVKKSRELLHRRPAVLRRGARCGRIERSQASARLILLPGQRWNQQQRSVAATGTRAWPQQAELFVDTLLSHLATDRKRTPPRAASTPVDRSSVPARDDPRPGVGKRTSGGAYQSDVEDG